VSIALSIPSIGSLNADALGLNRADLAGAGLNSVTGPLLSNPNSQPPPLPALPANSGLAIQNAASTGSTTAVAGVDLLTPRGLTASGAVALTNVISTVTTTLNSVQSNSLTGFTQLVQSPGFQVLLQVLGVGDNSGTAGNGAAVAGPAQLTSLLASSPAPGSAAASSTGASASSTPGAASAGTHVSTNPSPYFEKLLGELQNTFNSSSTSTGDSVLNTSELELFLKWLSINGASSVVASA
jgi:hypothetical protein